MKTRSFFIVAFLALLFSSNLSGQTEKGSVLIGAQSRAQLTAGVDFTSSPQLAVFLADQFALGANVQFSYAEESLLLGFQPLARFYFIGTGNARPFVQANLLWSKFFIESWDVEYFGYGGGIGVDVFLSKAVAFELMFGYDRHDDTGILGLGIGVAAFISPPQD